MIWFAFDFFTSFLFALGFGVDNHLDSSLSSLFIIVPRWMDYRSSFTQFVPYKLSIPAYSAHNYLSSILKLCGEFFFCALFCYLVFFWFLVHKALWSIQPLSFVVIDVLLPLVCHTGGLLGLPFCVLCVPAYLWLLPSQVQCLCTRARCFKCNLQITHVILFSGATCL